MLFKLQKSNGLNGPIIPHYLKTCVVCLIFSPYKLLYHILPKNYRNLELDRAKVISSLFILKVKEQVLGKAIREGKRVQTTLQTFHTFPKPLVIYHFRHEVWVVCFFFFLFRGTWRQNSLFGAYLWSSLNPKSAFWLCPNGKVCNML